MGTFKKIKKEYIKQKQIFVLNTQNHVYLKKSIDQLVQLQKSIRSKWLSPEQAHEYMNSKMLQYYTFKMGKIRYIEIPQIVRGIAPTGKYLYKKEDIARLIEEIEKNKQFDQLDISNPALVLETAIKEIYNLQFPQHALQTAKTWFYFTKKEVVEINRSEHGTRSYIKQMIWCTELLIDATEETGKEIFHFTSNEMNLYFMGPEDIPKDYKRVFYKFITDLYTHLQSLAKSAGKKPFNLNHVIDINDIPIKKERVKDIYPFSQYLHLYDYANNISFHKKKAIDDARKNIQGLKCSRYDSMWLFMLINLNNPWNHQEITLLPSIDLSGTKITNLDWLENNDIDFKDAKSIFMQFRLWDSKREKTGVQQNFHISNELLHAFGTAAAICKLRNDKEQFPLENQLIDFKTSSQRLKHTHKPYRAFFSDFDSNFRYDNLKLARSIISYKNVILSEFIEPGDDSLKRDRGHSHMESTNIYVQIPKEHVDFLSKQLFSRDFMGNIYYHLSNIFYGETKDRPEQTERIIALKEHFGNVLRVEGISGILNELDSERNAVREIIYGLDTSTAATIYNKLNCNALPAKEKDYQCVSYPKGCLYSGRNCSRCPLSVPNYLAIMRIIDNVIKTIYEMENGFHKATNQEKTVLANKLDQYLLDFGACVSQFSESDMNEIYNLMSIKRQDFISLLSSLPEYEQYISYKPKLEGK